MPLTVWSSSKFSSKCALDFTAGILAPNTVSAGPMRPGEEGGLLLWRPNNETNKIDLCLSSLMCRHPEGDGEECTYMSQCVCVCVKERMHIFMHVCVYVCIIYAYTHIHVYICVHICMHVYVYCILGTLCVYVYVYVCTYACVYICMYIYWGRQILRERHYGIFCGRVSVDTAFSNW